MKCNKCNHILPDDSEFCQYCGNKIEVGFVISTDIMEDIEENNGAKKSTKAPNGFVFVRPKTSTPQKNGVRTSKSHVTRKNLPNDKLLSFTNISSIILTIISMLSVIIAMNIQDIKRNVWENLNPTAIYVVILLILGAFLGFAINSFIKKKFKLLSGLSTIPVLAAIIASAEYSIMSYGYYDGYSYKYYINNDEVATFNGIWITCVVLALIVTLIPVIITAISKMKNEWHKSISYREKCYKRVAKIHGYLEKGIITEAEYEKTKNDILKYIE